MRSRMSTGSSEDTASRLWRERLVGGQEQDRGRERREKEEGVGMSVRNESNRIELSCMCRAVAGGRCELWRFAPSARIGEKG